MTPLSPTALGAAAKAAYHATPRNKPYDNLPPFKKNLYRAEATAAITAYLEARRKEGFVEVDDGHASAIWKQAEDCVPTNWCDSLLTGPTASKVPLDCPAVERLMLGIVQRIRLTAKLAAAQKGER